VPMLETDETVLFIRRSVSKNRFIADPLNRLVHLRTRGFNGILRIRGIPEKRGMRLSVQLKIHD